jgi:hypothetical protein
VFLAEPFALYANNRGLALEGDLERVGAPALANAKEIEKYDPTMGLFKL